MQLGEGRITYFNPDYDIAIVELKESDGITDYLELDDNLFKEETKAYYKDISIYILQYPHGNIASVSYGLSTDIIDFEIRLMCSTDNGSSGSPILNLSNNKVIGIHKQASIRYNFNMGTCLKFPLHEFLEKENCNLNKSIDNNINNDSNISIDNNPNILTNLVMAELLNDINDQMKPGPKIMDLTLI